MVVGDRSEAILMAPLIHRFRSSPSIQTIVCVAGRNRHAIDQLLDIFGIQPDAEFGQPEQVQSADGPKFVDIMIEKHKPDCVLMHGEPDFAIDSRYLNAPLSCDLKTGLHMHELRHGSTSEERRNEIERLATYYFVPSEASRDNLLREGVAAEKIYLTDSMAVDALLMVAERIHGDDVLKNGLAAAFPFLDPKKRLIFVAGHKHGNEEGRLESLCRALKRLAMRADVQVVYPLHPDAKQNSVVDEVFASHPNITLIQPQDYLHFVYLMQSAYLILTDLDDTLKEALSLCKPILVLRDVAERPQAIDAGNVKLVGTETERILRECVMFLDDPAYYRAFSSHRNLYVDGHTGQRIVEMLLR
ncbi:non-hydrolyzing UDP-N-acetylglucosamine 2-epimerase [Sideroxydans lithotrophicus]|uniref:non-hydrolyzing UDP-N-acetylglucosamine 2-epimerase n=1 Tax=Sideroxydans lithotrophicus TaxID=63745 RepID=UPI001CBC5C12|nr:UDP-N-acetylglucosamine 2-epimerase (non-hydrolyzing) [Sideroxydans lithotrophicus]